MTHPDFEDFLGYDESDFALDRRLASAQAELLATITAALDLDAGLAAITGRPRPQPAAADVYAIGPDRVGEIDAITTELRNVRQVLGPLTDPQTGQQEGVSGSLFFVAHVASLVAHLQHGLAERRLSRTEAAELQRLIEHNLAESRVLLAGEHRRARRRARRNVQMVRDLVEDIHEQIRNLGPRIMRLFEDSGHAAEREPVPH
jgi:hypothetical protein